MIVEKTVDTGCDALVMQPVSGKISFASYYPSGGDNMFFYLVEHENGTEWEYGTGHLKDCITLARDTVIQSSNRNRPVCFSAGHKIIRNHCLGKMISGDKTYDRTVNGCPAGS